MHFRIQIAGAQRLAKSTACDAYPIPNNWGATPILMERDAYPLSNNRNAMHILLGVGSYYIGARYIFYFEQRGRDAYSTGMRRLFKPLFNSELLKCDAYSIGMRRLFYSIRMRHIFHFKPLCRRQVFKTSLTRQTVEEEKNPWPNSNKIQKLRNILHIDKKVNSA